LGEAVKIRWLLFAAAAGGFAAAAILLAAGKNQRGKISDSVAARE
jgi:hypothetical protein